jgi:hypothetical protein
VRKERCTLGLTVTRKSTNVQEPTSHRDHSQDRGRLCFNHIYLPNELQGLDQGCEYAPIIPHLGLRSQYPAAEGGRRGHLGLLRRVNFAEKRAPLGVEPSPLDPRSR